MIKYKITAWCPHRIDLVEVERETRKTVFLKSDIRGEWKQLKHSEHHNYLNSWDEAHAKLLARAELELNCARTALMIAQGNYGNVKGMKKPEGEKDEALRNG